eukprot:CAMPEP_0114690540 /NCGR_PEP_ID=MMETSP0191-20121206/65824_1 /TAXON_ID=126664 /ORGANISM="Sorites sp." /LENGTH=520 /DNA_ID=CAMNT_0001980613 /DNA_START=56 /DNA_END=1619 /DNA_ORIENTATION=-
MNFTSYVVLVVLGVVAHAFAVHEQFYPAVIYLSTDKICLAVMYNFVFALFLLFGKVLLRIFIGTLRDVEVEQLVDSGRGFLAETILFLVFYAPTIDNREVGTVFLIQYICCVIFMKVFHLTTQIRVSHMFEVGVPRLIVTIKLVGLMALLLGCDLLALNYFYSVASKSSTFFTWILFEALTMSTVVLVSMCRYSIHMIDLRLENGWPAKSVCLFYVDLIHDVVSMTLFLIFMLTFFVQNPSRLPIYMMADVIQVARKLAQRLRSFRRYRCISRNMEMRFPDATDAEIEENEHCVICRDSLFDGSKPKKLPCGHIFHIDCLKSWLVMQQVCPTCRAEIPADGPLLNGTPAQIPQIPEDISSGSSSTSSSAVPTNQPAAPSEAVSSSSIPRSNGQVVEPVAEARSSGCSVRKPTASVGLSSAGGSLGTAGATGPASIGNNTSGHLPPLQEILDALGRAEEVATFLREQQSFWIEQVRQIQSNVSRQPSAGEEAAATPIAPMPGPVLSMKPGCVGHTLQCPDE